MEDLEILYQDKAILVCVKPAGVLSTDEPGGVPALLREQLGADAPALRTVHRLDRVVGGLMVLGCGAEAASALSRQIREGSFGKEYLAVIKARKMSFVVPEPGKDVQEALLDYRTLGRARELSLVRIRLHTGRTHQIRCQFAAHGWPLAGERKYDTREDPWPLALWSARLRFLHPVTGAEMDFRLPPPEAEPWSLFPDTGSFE